MTNSVLRVGVAGAGHFGRYHALKVAGSARTRLTGIFDPDLERAKTVGWEAGAKEVGFNEMLDLVDAVIVAAPAEAHYQLAVRALRAGKHVLVEKPIAATLQQADEMAALASERGLVLQVGHLERFSAAYQVMAGRIGAPLYIEATRIAPFKPRGTDVSVILDLMIHDLDLILGLIDSEIENVDAVGAPVASPHEDIASARLGFGNGAVATITASRISPRTERRMRIFAQHAYMAADFSARTLTVIGRTSGALLPGQQPVPRGCRVRDAGGVVGRPRFAGRRTCGVRRVGAGWGARAGRCRGRPARPGRGAGGGRQHAGGARTDDGVGTD